MGPEAWVYIDESGTVRQGQPFTIGIFITWRDAMWRDIIRRVRSENKYSAHLHFRKMSRSTNERRRRVYDSVIAEFEKYLKSWYARTVYVGAQNAQYLKAMSEVDAYDLLMTEVAERFVPAVRNRHINVVLSEKSRPLDDNYLPTGLESRLNQLSASRGWNKTFSVSIRPARQDDMLQISDLLASTESQIRVPSENPNKLAIARRLLYGPCRQRIGRWELGLVKT